MSYGGEGGKKLGEIYTVWRISGHKLTNNIIFLYVFTYTYHKVKETLLFSFNALPKIIAVRNMKQPGIT